MKSKDGINLRESQQDGDERHRTLTLTRERFNTCRTLQRNFQACCEAAKSRVEHFKDNFENVENSNGTYRAGL